ncbi:hypothetical protein GGS24DRAFT_466673, partial [Hypoxylon argillaceum]
MAIIWFSENAVVTSYFVGFSFFGVFFPPLRCLGFEAGKRRSGGLESKRRIYAHLGAYVFCMDVCIPAYIASPSRLLQLHLDGLPSPCTEV